MGAVDRLSPCGRLARQHDRDRYLVALLAPPEAREAQFAIIAFNHEIARIRDLVSEPLLGRIRLQWWRDAIAELYDGAARRHEVVEPLGEAIRRHELSRSHFDGLIDARERDLEEAGFATLAEMETYAEATAAPVLRLALETVGAGGEDAPPAAASHVGTAWAMAGLLRAVPFHARKRHVLLPADLLHDAGTTGGEVVEKGGSAAVARVAEQVAARAHDHLAAARALRRQVPARARAALAAAVVVEAHLRRLHRNGYDVFHQSGVAPSPPHLRLTWAVLRGRY